MRHGRSIALILSLLFLAGCATIRLERRLAPDIRKFYELHSIFMDTDIPKWISEKRITERRLFLILTEAKQQEYVKRFWEMRTDFAGELFGERLEAVNDVFRHEAKDGWQTDRGQLCLLVGFPDDVYWYESMDGSTFERGVPQGEGVVPGAPNAIQRWVYFVPGFGSVVYDFTFSPPYSWRRMIDSLAEHSLQVEFEKRWREFFAPTEDGWDIVASIIMEKSDGR